MALHAVPKSGDNPEDDSGVTVACPVCAGRMDTVYDRLHQRVVVCVDCQSGLTVPATAWDVARIKRESKWMPEP
jgi:hypothetical protein